MRSRSALVLGSLFLSVMVAMGLCANSSHAAVIVLTDPLDGNANDSNLDGVWDTLIPGPLTQLLAYNGGSSYNIRGALEFDIRSIRRPAHIDDATLLVSYTGANGEKAKTLQFNGFAGNGVLELSDFQNRNPVGPRYNAFGPDDGSNVYKVPVTAFLQSVVDSGASHVGFMVENLATNQTSLGGYYGLIPPELRVTYTVVPEPGGLTGLAVGGLWLVRRRRTA